MYSTHIDYRVQYAIITKNMLQYNFCVDFAVNKINIVIVSIGSFTYLERL